MDTRLKPTSTHGLTPGFETRRDELLDLSAQCTHARGNPWVNTHPVHAEIKAQSQPDVRHSKSGPARPERPGWARGVTAGVPPTHAR
jgi:hypothetical protein